MQFLAAFGVSLRTQITAARFRAHETPSKCISSSPPFDQRVQVNVKLRSRFRIFNGDPDQRVTRRLANSLWSHGAPEREVGSLTSGALLRREWCNCALDASTILVSTGRCRTIGSHKLLRRFSAGSVALRAVLQSRLHRRRNIAELVSEPTLVLRLRASPCDS